MKGVGKRVGGFPAKRADFRGVENPGEIGGAIEFGVRLDGRVNSGESTDFVEKGGNGHARCTADVVRLTRYALFQNDAVGRDDVADI